MVKSASEIFNDKVRLIYEYDRHSPLFVRMANTEIEKNNVDRAIEILNEGLKIYPNYAAAYLVLAKAFTLAGEYQKAIQAAKTGSDLIHSKHTYEFYVREIENIRKQRSLFETTRGQAFFSPELIPDHGERPDLFEEKSPALAKKYETPLDERLDELASELSKAKIPESNSSMGDDEISLDQFDDENLIVSETLAKIYIAQGEYAEAIGVYKKLIKKFPNNADYYKSRIKELSEEIQ